MPDIEPVKILVFGTTSVGKSSLINLLTGSNLKIGEGKAEGTTFTSTYVDCIHNGIKYKLIDTAGLNEARGGTVDAAKAIKDLIELITKTKSGLNLIIYVRKCEPITNMDEKNYDIIIKTLFANRMKTLVVNTFAEQYATDGKTMNTWWNQNKFFFAERNIPFDGGLSACVSPSVGNPRFDAIYREYSEQSKSAIWEAIIKHKSEHPIANQGTYREILIRVWNKFIEILSYIPLAGRFLSKLSYLNTNLESHLTDLGVPPLEAKKISIDFAGGIIN